MDFDFVSRQFYYQGKFLDFPRVLICSKRSYAEENNMIRLWCHWVRWRNVHYHHIQERAETYCCIWVTLLLLPICLHTTRQFRQILLSFPPTNKNFGFPIQYGRGLVRMGLVSSSYSAVLAHSAESEIHVQVVQLERILVENIDFLFRQYHFIYMFSRKYFALVKMNKKYSCKNPRFGGY